MRESFEQYRKKCEEEVSSLQQEFNKRHNLDRYELCSIDEDFAVLQFKSDDGRELHFRYSMVGSFYKKTSTWIWAWNNEFLKPTDYKGLDEVRTFGEKNKFTALTTGSIDADEDIAWGMTCISAKVMNAIGVYRLTEKYHTYYFVFTHEITKEQ